MRIRPVSSASLLFATLLTFVPPMFAAPPLLPSPEERRRIQEISTHDRQRLLDLLGIKTPANLPREDDDPNRPPDVHRDPKDVKRWTNEAGYFVVRSEWGHWINYHESKAETGLPLPDPLALKSGDRVINAETWWKRRRPEIAQDFTTEIYGQIPANTPVVRWELVEEDAHALDDRAIRKHVVGHIDNSRYPAATPRIELALYLPRAAKGPVPVVVMIGGFDPPPGVTIPGAPTGPSPLEQTIAHGWGFAKYEPRPLQADNGAGLTEGIIGLVNAGQPRTPGQWGAIAAWSWGLSRVIDYFETVPEIDARRLAAEGHSRFGKTALVAGSLDPRWAVVYSSCSGASGAKLHRHDYGESLDIVASSGEYHWMAGNFLKYAGHWRDLPIDQHELIALIAPRPVFVTGGTDDPWADPVGMFRACVAASPVYQLLGAKGLERETMPAPDEMLLGGDLVFRYHKGGHFDQIDWAAFLQFADKYFSPRNPK